jgi:hypothetical protein
MLCRIIRIEKGIIRVGKEDLPKANERAGKKDGGGLPTIQSSHTQTSWRGKGLWCGWAFVLFLSNFGQSIPNKQEESIGQFCDDFGWERSYLIHLSFSN